MKKQKNPGPSVPERTVALCYVRQSFTREEKIEAGRVPSREADEADAEHGNEQNSPKRQRANIQAVCDRNGWTPEWYQDAEGHKSGRDEKNRPGWLSLKERLSDPDVIALVANDLSRLHRKGWRVGDLIDYLDQYGVRLVLAAPGREIDLSTPMGRLFVQFTAILDEWYAADISARAKDSIAHRKAQGLSVGMPPFGTVRGADGFLKPSSEGAWFLSNRTFQAGEADQPPAEGAVWHSYYETARYILTLYATGENGLEKISYLLNREGWPFRDRTGTPRLFERDDVRRVVANWPEYGGVVLNRKAKDRPGYQDYDVAEIPFNSDRAVFPIPLLKEVATVRQARTRRPANDGVKRDTHPYPLTGITYCAQCERNAIAANNPGLRTRLGGMGGRAGTPRYRHKMGIKCGCKSLSVHKEVMEAEFLRLIRCLMIKPEMLSLMTELAIQAEHGQFRSDTNLEQAKQEAITLCRRRIDAAVTLFGDGIIDHAEYRRRVDANQREIAHWEARTDETEQLALELGMCVEALDKLARLWDINDDENRQGLARSLFETIVFDLDSQKIVSFRLKSWADRFMVLRAELYEGELSATELALVDQQGMYKAMPHRRFELLF
jgi:DNA invertase Pin-like site-specific DNA recombinase